MHPIVQIALILSSTLAITTQGYDGTIMEVVGEYFYRMESLTPNLMNCRSSFASDLKWAFLPAKTAKDCSKVCIREFTWCLAFRMFDVGGSKMCVIGEIGEDTYHLCYPYYRVPGTDCNIHLVILLLEPSCVFKK